MKDIENTKKESPILSLTGMGGGVSSFAVLSGRAGPSYTDPGQQAYTTPGSYTWVGGKNTLTISMVAVSGGGGGQTSARFSDAAGAGGGGLRYSNDVAIDGNADYTIVVGAGGNSGSSPTDGGSSYVEAEDGTKLVLVTGGVSGDGGPNGRAGGGSYGTNVGDGGGDGGSCADPSYRSGGGGAGGYSGDGGDGQAGGDGSPGGDGSGGGAGGGGGGRSDYTGEGCGGAGGGVGIFGEGSNGEGGNSRACAPYGPNPRGNRGGYGSGGPSGTEGNGQQSCITANDNAEGLSYGGGAGSQSDQFTTKKGGGGAVRLIWPGDARAFPSTRTADE